MFSLQESFRALDTADFWGLTVVLGLVALGLFVHGFLLLRRARIMEDTPTARIRSAAQGYIEIEGTAQLLQGDPIHAPLTRMQCCWWSYKIEHRDRSSKNNHWDTLESEVSGELFQLIDATGDCVVDPHQAKVIPSERFVWYGSSRHPSTPPKVASGWLRSIGADYRYTEEVIHLRSPLYAIGHFRTQAGATSLVGTDADVRELLAKWKRDPQMIKLLDVNADGRLDQREWEAARRMAQQQVLREAVSEPLAEDVNILGAPRDRRPFVLSTLPQAKMIRRDRRQGFAALVISILAGALCTYALQARAPWSESPESAQSSDFNDN